ncbi:MAG: hypothetical protein N3G21_02070 [Candidatus Hydrogenedentes bacterium]|nr:hypothetical protein [Candidatus Hydrogenedentota bacterium]
MDVFKSKYLVLIIQILCILITTCSKDNQGQVGSPLSSAVEIGGEGFYLEFSSSPESVLDNKVIVFLVKDRNSTLDTERLRKTFIEELREKILWVIFEGDWGSLYKKNIKDNSEIERKICETFSKLRKGNDYLFVVWIGETAKVMMRSSSLQKCIDGAILVISDSFGYKEEALSEIRIPFLIYAKEDDLNAEVWAKNLCNKSKSLCEFRSFALSEDASDSIVLLETAKHLMLNWISTISNTSLN